MLIFGIRWILHFIEEIFLFFRNTILLHVLHLFRFLLFLHFFVLFRFVKIIFSILLIIHVSMMNIGQR